MLAMLGGLALFLYGMDMMGKGARAAGGHQLRSDSGEADGEPGKGVSAGSGDDGGDSVVVGDDGDGRRLRQFGADEAASGVRCHHGGERRHDGDGVDPEPVGHRGDSLLLRLLTPSAFSPVLALAGAVMYLFFRRDRVKNAGAILLGFAILMFGMETMSGAVEPLAGDPGFARLFTMFSNPILGVLTGAVLTAVIQSSSASVGILQALSATGAVTYASAIPIIMGQNIAPA